MDAYFEGRASDSPYIEIVWRGHVERDYDPVCPADVRWNLLFTRQNRQTRVSVEGATNQFVPKQQVAGVEFLVIKFKLGVYLPYLPAGKLVNGDAFLPEGVRQSFWLDGQTWPLPDYDTVEAFVERLVRHEALIVDPVVSAAVHPDHRPQVSSRTVRRHFLHTTGLTPKTIQQIERAQAATTLLEQGTPILDVVYATGYADQAHLTRSLRRFTGQTPAQILRAHPPA